MDELIAFLFLLLVIGVVGIGLHELFKWVQNKINPKH